MFVRSFRAAPALACPALPFPAVARPAVTWPAVACLVGLSTATSSATAQSLPDRERRSQDEQTALYVASGLYGVGTGVWIDGLFTIKDPGLAVVFPIALGAAGPIATLVWDERSGHLHRGVPSSIATGVALGTVEGLAVAGTQWQYTHEKGSDWSFQTSSTLTWLLASGGAVGGWAFGEAIRPDPRTLGFVGGGAAWGAISGSFFGIAASGQDWKDGASIAGLIGYNVGIAGAGALGAAVSPSWRAQRSMWLGYGLGTLAGSVVFPFYLFVDNADAKHGFIGPAIGGLAGLAIGGALGWQLRDPDDTQRANAGPDFNVAVASPPHVETSRLGLGDGFTAARPSGAVVNGSMTLP